MLLADLSWRAFAVHLHGLVPRSSVFVARSLTCVNAINLSVLHSRPSETLMNLHEVLRVVIKLTFELDSGSLQSLSSYLPSLVKNTFLMRNLITISSTRLKNMSAILFVN